MNRKESNKKILQLLEKKLEESPDLRFIQALWALKIIDQEDNHIIDRFYEEPSVTLKRIWQKES